MIWSDAEERSFEQLKQNLISAPVLMNYDRNLQLKLACDASGYGLGAVLSHVLPDKSERPIAFASRTLNDHENKYSQLDKEGASIIFGIKKFNQYVFGRRFTLSTDNKSLRHIFDPKADLSSVAVSRIARWEVFMNPYEYDIEYRPTTEHANADMLSRLPIDETTKINVNALYSHQINTLPVSAVDVMKETEKDDLLKQVKDQNGNWPDIKNIIPELREFYDKRNELSLENGIIMWNLRVVISRNLEKSILRELHDQHPGIARMKSLSRVHVWFPGINNKIVRGLRQSS